MVLPLKLVTGEGDCPVRYVFCEAVRVRLYRKPSPAVLLIPAKWCSLSRGAASTRT